MSEERKEILEKLNSSDKDVLGLGIEEEVGEIENPKKTKMPTKSKPMTETELLASISIDVNNIEISEKSPLEVMDDIDFIMNNKPTYQIVANQSCYIAHMQSLRMEDISAITSSTSDIYSSNQKLYKVIYNKISNTSIGIPDFKTWLRITSLFDLPTFFYGIYCQSFPGDTKFEITCRHCKSKTDIVVNNNTLVSVKDDDAFANLTSILGKPKTTDELLSKSLVNKFIKFVLPNSKILLEIQTPSMHDYLQLLASVNKEKLVEMEDIISTMLFIKNLYILDMTELKRTGKAKYVLINDKDEIAGLVRKLEYTDSNALAEKIEERLNKYAIEYKIQDSKCSKCSNSLGEIPVDMENLLFTQIR